MKLYGCTHNTLPNTIHYHVCGGAFRSRTRPTVPMCITVRWHRMRPRRRRRRRRRRWFNCPYEIHARWRAHKSTTQIAHISRPHERTHSPALNTTLCTGSKHTLTNTRTSQPESNGGGAHAKCAATTCHLHRRRRASMLFGPSY